MTGDPSETQLDMTDVLNMTSGLNLQGRSALTGDAELNKLTSQQRGILRRKAEISAFSGQSVQAMQLDTREKQQRPSLCCTC